MHNFLFLPTDMHDDSFIKKIYNLFADYPHNMTAEEVKIFDNENPYWAAFFKDRKNES